MRTSLPVKEVIAQAIHNARIAKETGNRYLYSKMREIIKSVWRMRNSKTIVLLKTL
jgi:hypothetical protein